MKANPILFSAPMVRAILNNSKTQTRRTVKPPHDNPLGKWEPTTVGGPNGGHTAAGETIPEQGAIWHTRTGDTLLCPYGQPGHRLYIKETFWAYGRWETRFNRKKGRDERYFFDMTLLLGMQYQYEEPPVDNKLRRRGGVIPTWWKRPSIFMPRIASRILLEITGARVERLQDIGEEDAHAEGVDNVLCAEAVGRSPLKMGMATQCGFAYLWEKINGAGSWDANPWVWIVEFERVQP